MYVAAAVAAVVVTKPKPIVMLDLRNNWLQLHWLNCFAGFGMFFCLVP